MNDKTATSDKGPIRIDLASVLKARNATAHIPAFVVRRLEKLICQDRLNEMLRVAYPRRGAEFCRAVLDHLGISVDVVGAERLPDMSRRVIYVSNHPLGGLDGMVLIDLIARRHGVKPCFVVNDFLNAVEPLSDVFLPINKHGAQSRANIEAIDRAMAGDRPVIIFPAGLCSRRRHGVVADLEWHKMFVVKAREYGRAVVPLHFCGRNSMRFYRLARLRERLGIRLNIEMALLPGEIFKAEGSHFDIVCGDWLAPEALAGDPREVAARLRQSVISLESLASSHKV